MDQPLLCRVAGLQRQASLREPGVGVWQAFCFSTGRLSSMHTCRCVRAPGVASRVAALLRQAYRVEYWADHNMCRTGLRKSECVQGLRASITDVAKLIMQLHTLYLYTEPAAADHAGPGARQEGVQSRRGGSDILNACPSGVVLGGIKVGRKQLFVAEVRMLI